MAEHPFQPLNPALRLPPTSARSHSRTSSRSPDRRSWFFTHELDPLLNNLSPQSTLQALSTTDSVPTDEKTAHDLLAQSIAQVSTAERALGIRAAVAAQKLREWHIEILSWDWPSAGDSRLGKGFLPPIKTLDNSARPWDQSPSTGGDAVDEYMGSLPAFLVERYESRIDEIKDGMDALDVDELKEHVLNAHIPSRSRPSSSKSVICTAPQRLSYVQLSDFTAVITATILQALPWLSRLNILLNVWDVRLVVLWQIPGLLESLKVTRTAIDASLESLNSQTPPNENDALFSQSSFRAARQNLEYLVVFAGSKIDRILDSLEGRDDSLPEVWIDDMEAIEADFGTWVVEAEKLALRNEWSRMNISSNNPKIAAQEESKIPESEDRSEVDHFSEVPQSPTGLSPESEEEIEPTSNQPFEEILPRTPTDTIDTTQTPVEEPSTSPSTGSEESENSPPSTAQQEDKRVSPIEPDTTADREYTPSTGSSSSSDTEEDPSSVSDESLTAENVISETCDLPATPVQTQHSRTNGKHHAEDTPRDSVNVITPKELPQPPENILDSVASARTDSSPEPSRNQSVDTAIPQPDIQSSQTPRLNESFEEISGDIDLKSPIKAPTEDDINQFGSLEALEVSPDTVITSHLPDVPSDEGDIESRPDTAVNSPASSVVRPSPEINVTSFSSPAQSDDEDISPRNASFGQQLKLSADPSNAPSSTTSTVPFSFVQDPKTSSKKFKHKPGPLDMSAINARSHRRNISADSFASDCHSGASSPEIKDAQTATSHGSPMVVEATARWTQTKHSLLKPSQTHSEQTVQGLGLYRRTTDPPSSAESLELGRTTSLPLQRFIDDDFYHVHGRDDGFESLRPADIKRASVASIEVLPKAQLRSIVLTRKGSSSSVSDARTAPILRHSTSNLSQYSDTKGDSIIEEEDTTRHPGSTNSPDNLSVHRDSSAEEQSPLLRVFDRRQRPAQSPTSPISPIIPRRSSKRISKQPDLKASGPFANRSHKQPPSSPGLVGQGFAPVTPINSHTGSSHVKSSEDQLEEKINSILTTIPARIKLGAAPDQNLSASSSKESTYSGGKGDSYGSGSPRSTPTRSSTPTPSLTLTPAFARSKRTHVHSGDEPSVRLYHLHRGGKSAPVKLFVRPVGENGERVMVRVGGGWADLGEYLREYAVHHGHRTTSDGRFDVQGLPASSSPAYSSPATTITPTTNNGRSTPISRPGSALSARPSSSLAVRKTRKSTISGAEPPSLTSANVQRISEDSPALPPIPKRHRLSMSSTTSVGMSSAVGDSPYSSTTTPNTTHSTPLGLSGPKPKARHVSMTPESEAWVEGVIGQARKTSSSLKPKRSIPGFRSSRFKLGIGKDDSTSNGKGTPETKTRSVSDIGSLGLNRRVFLRGLGKDAKEKD